MFAALYKADYLWFRTPVVVRLLHDGIVEVVKVQFSLQRHLVIRVQKIEGENCLGTEHRRQVPTNAQELSKPLKISAFGAIAETDADGVVTRKVDDEYMLRFRGERTTIPGVS